MHFYHGNPLSGKTKKCKNNIFLSEICYFSATQHVPTGKHSGYEAFLLYCVGTQRVKDRAHFLRAMFFFIRKKTTAPNPKILDFSELNESQTLIFSGIEVLMSTIEWPNMSPQLHLSFEIQHLVDFAFRRNPSQEMSSIFKVRSISQGYFSNLEKKTLTRHFGVQSAPITLKTS